MRFSDPPKNVCFNDIALPDDYLGRILRVFPTEFFYDNLKFIDQNYRSIFAKKM